MPALHAVQLLLVSASGDQALAGVEKTSQPLRAYTPHQLVYQDMSMTQNSALPHASCLKYTRPWTRSLNSRAPVLS